MKTPIIYNIVKYWYVFRIFQEYDKKKNCQKKLEFPMKIKKLDHLSKIYKEYDAFIIDLWGVMHNGIRF